MSQNLTAKAWRNRDREDVLESVEKILKSADQTSKDFELQKLSHDYALSPAILTGSTGFYDFLAHADKKIHVCNGTACLNAGTQVALKEKIREHFDDCEIGEVSCVGLCHRNHSLLYGGTTASCGDKESLQKLLDGKPLGQKPFTYVSGDKSVLIEPQNRSENETFKHYQEVLLQLKNSPQKILGELKESLLRGRGGAGFPFAIKLGAFHEAEGNEKYLVCNADEGDPGAWSDRYLLEYNPQAVLFGMALCSYLTGAEHGILYIRAEYPECHRSVQDAIHLWQQSGLCEKMAMNFQFKIVKGHGAYVCGEETALINAIEGKRGEVRVKPPLPVHQGLYGKPTLVTNVETLASIPWIMKHGGKAFASIGSAESKGTKLISTDSFFQRPGLYEIPMGIKLRDFVYEVAGGFKSPVKAIQIGGPLGSVIAVRNFGDLELSFESLKEAGYALGHGSIVCIPEHIPMQEFLCHLFDFSAKESCGKCFPCRIGTQRGYELWREAPRHKIDRNLLNDLLDTLEFTSLCSLGGGLPLPVRNILDAFADELTPYFYAAELGEEHG